MGSNAIMRIASPSPDGSTNQTVSNSFKLGRHPIVNQVLPTDLPVRFVAAVRASLEIRRAFKDGAQAFLYGGVMISRDQTTRALFRPIRWAWVPVSCRVP